MAFQSVANLNKENIVSPPPKIIAPAPAVSVSAHSRRHRARESPSRHAAIQSAARRQRYAAQQRASPVVDVEMSEAAASDPARVRIRFPATLARPVFKDIDPDALAAIDTELASTPLEYIHEKLRAAGPRCVSGPALSRLRIVLTPVPYSMLTAITRAQPAPSSGMPKEIEVVINDLSAEVPTHVFAVWSKDRLAGPRQVELFPAHSIVFASTCAHLPAFPASKPTQPAAEGDAITLPVVPLCVPSRPTFGLLQHYLYTRSANRLLNGLLPKVPHGVPPQHTARYLAQTFTPAVLARHVAGVHAFWSNVAALGIFDDALWRVIDLAWAVLMTALREAEHSGVRVEQQ